MLPDQTHPVWALLTAAIDKDDAHPLWGLLTGLFATGVGGEVATNVARQYSKAQNFALTTLVDEPEVQWDVESNQVTELTLAGSRNLAAPVNVRAGATYLLFIEQGAGGNHTLTWDPSYKWADGQAPQLSANEGAVDLVAFVARGTDLHGVAHRAFS